MKRAVCVILLIVVFSFISGCAESPETVPAYENAGYSSDMDGMIIDFLSDWSGDDPFNMGIDTTYGDMMIDRVNNVETAYNCEIKYSTNSSISAYVLSCMASGLKAGDLYYGRQTFSLCQADCLFPLTEVSETVDYTDENKYGTANLLEYSMKDGVPYGVVPVMWPSKISSANMGPIMVLGEELIRRYRLDDPRDFYEQGVWNLEKLEEITPLFHIKDGENDIKALYGSNANFSCGIFDAVGMTMVTETSDGVLTAGYNTPEMHEVLTWANEYCAKYADDIVIDGGYDAYSEVADGNAVIGVMASYIMEIAQALDDFGIVPFPCDSRFIQSGEQRSYYDFFDCLAILLTTEEPDNSAVLLSALCEPFEGYYSTWNELADFLNRTLFFDERDGYAFITIVRNAVCDYNPVGGYDAFSSSGLGQAFLNMSASEAIGKYANSQDEIIDKYIYSNYYGYMEEYWK